MKMTAKIVPYSSVVGSSITLHAESGFTVCQISLLNVIPPKFRFTPELHRDASTRIAEWVAAALNNAPQFEPVDLDHLPPAGEVR
jgi:hypothetical protein